MPRSRDIPLRSSKFVKPRSSCVPVGMLVVLAALETKLLSMIVLWISLRWTAAQIRKLLSIAQVVSCVTLFLVQAVVLSGCRNCQLTDNSPLNSNISSLVNILMLLIWVYIRLVFGMMNVRERCHTAEGSCESVDAHNNHSANFCIHSDSSGIAC